MSSITNFSSTLNRLIANAANYGRTDTLRVSALDGWRGIAIIIVLISHFGDIQSILPFERALFGRMGVDFFFVLSGLLMSNILFVKRVPLKKFYQRRMSRIFPVFIIYVVVIYFIAWIIGNSTETGNFLSTLFFLRSYIPIEADIWRTDLPISHLWSLNVEEHCYVILSLVTLLWFARKREYLVLFAVGLAALAIHYLYVRFPDLTTGRYSLRTETAASHLMLSAGYFLVRHHFEPYVKSWMPLLAIIAGVACYAEFAPWYAHWLFSPFLFAFAVNHVEQAPKALLWLFGFKPLQLMGIWSYSIYLWQEPFYQILSKGSVDYPGSSTLYVLVAIAVGLVSFYFIENPIRQTLNERWK